MYDDQIHWFAIVNSLIIVLFLSSMAGIIMIRTVYRQIADYNRLETPFEETRWKLVHGDVSGHPIIPLYGVFMLVLESKFSE